MNPRPADYKSAALPTELHQRGCRITFWPKEQRTAYVSVPNIFWVVKRLRADLREMLCPANDYNSDKTLLRNEAIFLDRGVRILLSLKTCVFNVTIPMNTATLQGGYAL